MLDEVRIRELVALIDAEKESDKLKALAEELERLLSQPDTTDTDGEME